MDGRSIITGNAREWRRLRALELRGRGWHQCDIAEALGVRDETISRWLAREGRRSRGPLRPPVAGPPAPALAGARAPDPGVPLARRGGVRLSRSGLDPAPASLGSSRRNWASTTTRATSASSSRHCAGRPRCRSGEPSSVTSWPSRPGVRRCGPRCSAGGKERRVLVFEDEAGLLPPAGAGTDLRPGGPDAGPPREGDARSTCR